MKIKSLSDKVIFFFIDKFLVVLVNMYVIIYCFIINNERKIFKEV